MMFIIKQPVEENIYNYLISGNYSD